MSESAANYEVAGKAQQSMSQIDKLLARLETLSPGHLYRILLSVDADGNPLAWVVEEVGKLEGGKTLTD